MNRFQIPQKGQNAINIDDHVYEYANRTYSRDDPSDPENVLRNTARLWLTPKQWQNQKNSSTANKTETSKTATTNDLKNTDLSMVYN
jgi:hypothetical protein